MKDIQETYSLTSIEQVKAIADPLRLRIIELLTHQAMTTTQLGEALGETSAKTHYHVHALERIGVIRLVETREKGGILEKYYRATAKDIRVAPEILNTAPADEITMSLQGWFRKIEQEAIKTIIRESPTITEGSTVIELAAITTYATVEEMRALLQDLNTLLEKYQEPRDIAGEQRWSMALIAHRLLAVEPPTPITIPGKVKSAHSFVLGIVSLNRADLEKTIAREEQMDLNITGFCSFANDVTPDLIEHAIGRFRQRGILTASPEIREALKRKSSS